MVKNWHDSKSRLNKLSKFNQIYCVLLKKNAVHFDLIDDFKFERHIKVINKVKISVCFYEKALKNRTISRYDRTIQGNISKKVSHYFKSALFEVALIKVFL